MPKLEENSLPGGIGVHIAEGGPEKQIQMVGVPNGNDNAYVVSSAIDIVPDRGAERFARVGARTPSNQWTDLIAISSMVQWTSHI